MKRNNPVSATLAFLSIMLFSSPSLSEIVVIVHPTNEANLSKKDISRIYLGLITQFPDGSVVIPIDQDRSNPDYAIFAKKVLKRTAQQLKQYWAQQLFSGKGTPPKEIGTSERIKKLVAENPALIGYIDSKEVDSSVRVIHRI